MQDADLLVQLAGIAGVFVGFGALISVRSGGPTEPQDIALMRAVVSTGLLAVVAALVPVTLGRYDLSEHQVWALSSALVLVGFLGTIAAMARTPEYGVGMATRRPGRLGLVEDSVETVAWLLFMAVLLLGPIVLMLGLAPDLEAALYVTMVTLLLGLAGWSLLILVFAERRPESA
jgi:hypothetical protein